MSGLCKKWTVDQKGGIGCQPAPVPQLIPGNLIVQVHAVCLLPSDCSRTCYSFAGTVLSSYTSSPHKIGAKVWGTYATTIPNEYTSIIMVLEWAVHKMKTNLSFQESSTLGGPALLACHALQIARLPSAGKPRVLIHGGHTAIGAFLTQAARVMKCQVECTAPIEHRDDCRNLGVTEFVDLIEGTPAGLTLSGFRGRRERNFHLVVDCLADDVTLYDYIEKYTHEDAKYITIKEKSVSWSGFFRRITTSVPRDYVYLANPLTAENAAKKLDLVNNILNHTEFVGVEIQDEYGVEDLHAAIDAVEKSIGFGCTVVEVVAPDSVEFEEALRLAMAEGQVPVPTDNGNMINTAAERSGSKDKLGLGRLSLEAIRPRRLSESRGTGVSDSAQRKDVFSLE